jgi:ribosomal protein L4
MGAHVQLPVKGNIMGGKVTGWKRKLAGTARGKASSNPLMDSWKYGIGFPDGSNADYTANVIAFMHSAMRRVTSIS